MNRLLHNISGNLSLILLLIFASIAIWLSFAHKHHKQDIARAETSSKALHKEIEALNNNRYMALEAFAMNINRQPVAMAIGIDLPHIAGGTLPLLYLKAYACSTCNSHIYGDLVGFLKTDTSFRIVSHPSNRFYLRQLLATNQVEKAKVVKFFEGNLLEPEFSPYDAELLFVNPQGQIVSGIPIDLLRDQSILNVVQGLLNK